MGFRVRKTPQDLATISNAASRLGEFPLDLRRARRRHATSSTLFRTGRGSSLLTIVEPVTSCQNALRSSSKDQPSGAGGWRLSRYRKIARFRTLVAVGVDVVGRAELIITPGADCVQEVLPYGAGGLATFLEDRTFGGVWSKM